MSLLRRSLTLFAAGILFIPAALGAQSREVVSKEVAVSRSEAALRLEFADEGRLEIVFEDGSVLVDGDVVGSFESGDELESAWRELLGRAIALDDGPLAQMLSDWTIPAELADELADVAGEIDRALEGALSSADVDISSDDATVSLSIGDESSLLRVLLNSTSRLGLMEQALEGLRDDFQIHVEEDFYLESDNAVDATVVVVGADARISGEVYGDVVVVDGTVELLDGSYITGAVRLADARVVRNLGTVEGGIIDLLDDERNLEQQIREELRHELRDELRSELRSELRNITRLDREEGFSLMAPFRPVIRGVGGVIENLIAVFVLGLLGMGAVAFAGGNVDAISETARRSPGRSAMVGVAGTLLLVPVWLLGAVALCVSIIGIPVAIAWLPLFPLVAAAAGVFGYLAVARNTGEWMSESGYPWTGWIRKSNPIHTVFGGLLGLMFAFIAADVLSMAPFLGFLTALLGFIGFVVTFMAIQIGLGAVILTRGGRRRERWNDPLDAEAAWQAAMEVEIEPDPTDTGDETDA